MPTVSRDITLDPGARDWELEFCAYRDAKVFDRFVRNGLSSPEDEFDLEMDKPYFAGADQRPQWFVPFIGTLAEVTKKANEMYAIQARTQIVKWLFFPKYRDQ